MRVLAILAATTLALPGCASMSAAEHAAHHPGAPTAQDADAQMQSMREMHEKMMAAKTPEEREKLMAEHMKAMQGGMRMMCQMGGGAKDGGDAMMKRCMDMKDMAERMMMDREAPKGR